MPDGKNSNDAEKNRKDFNASDIRFTKNGETVYATMLAWPGDNKEITIKSIKPKFYPNKIAKITMLGHEGDLAFEQTDEGLKVTLPASSPSQYAQVLKITH
ncbi:alpha-L-fucosidase C-terminal domain-containing protein [Paraglaciecola aquimarina]|uniref:Alpha-L-fucosidase C-terminal domain-containing protein n=1 Tax=Paraglaciecola aquimarina TaxID=1235557 RepID=A0ABU3SYR1_9ALTE|nr:alpha-L-fucosidase C-terminal domain-containing protein [Paraglaciecola aquimarina]MDU0355143.1 alpha-L-fucosidase C-terminal domain-containing protein [Paraglaciecola aquimarina]